MMMDICSLGVGEADKGKKKKRRRSACVSNAVISTHLHPLLLLPFHLLLLRVCQQTRYDNDGSAQGSQTRPGPHHGGRYTHPRGEKACRCGEAPVGCCIDKQVQTHPSSILIHPPLTTEYEERFGRKPWDRITPTAVAFACTRSVM